MNKNKPKPKKCKGSCVCASKKSKPKEPQNGKGDAPRNISSQFRANYDQIKWPEKS